MLDFEVITNNPPQVYDISPGEGQRSLEIEVYDRWTEPLKKIYSSPKDRPLLLHLQKSLDLPEFLSIDDRRWGYGGGIETVAESAPYLKLRVELPDGEKLKDDRWGEFYKASANLNMLFYVLNMADVGKLKDEDLSRQLLTIERSTERGLDGNSVWANLSPKFCSFLSLYEESERDSSLESYMKDCYRYLTGDLFSSLDQYRFIAMHRDPYWLNLSIPGNACGLDPEDYYPREKSGYKLLPHNIDSPLQQLTLVMGLAKLHQDARKLGY